MSTFYNLLSHINIKERDKQLLYIHLTNVANIMVNLAKNKGITDKEFLNVLYIVGMCHDFGKGSEYFQKYLLDGKQTELKNHGEISAYLTYYLLPERWKMYGFIAVKRHHGNIDLLDIDFFTPSNEKNILLIVESLKTNISELNNIYNINLEMFFESLCSGELFKEVKKQGKRKHLKFKGANDEHVITEYVYFQYIWSLLLTADKTQLVRGSEFISTSVLKADFTNKYKNKIRKEFIIKKSGIENSPLFNVRDEIYKTVISSIDNLDVNKEKFLSINVPTGTGKTISVYGGALRLKERLLKEFGYSSDIIYCLPFTSIIDQNYEVLEKILNTNDLNTATDFIMKYHSLTPIEYSSIEDKQYTDFDEKFLLDNWQSTVVTTTFIQLFNAIFKCGINSVIHRFHKIIGSIIILDEVQVIDPKYYKIIEGIFKVLCEKFNCYVITVTATKPLFLLGTELVTNNKDIFKLMNRIEFYNYSRVETTLKDFKRIISKDLQSNKDKSFLIILNTIKSSKEINEYIKELNDSRDVYYLSTELLPVDRLEIINKIKLSSKKTILISTQLIEAGIDIDYDIVYRDIAPLDSINQSAGRANRNGIGTKGIVKLFKLVDENSNLYCKIYSTVLIEQTLNILKDYHKINESEIFNLNNLYFKEVSRVTKNLSTEVYSKFIEYMRNYKFEKIRTDFELINENNFKIDVIVNRDSIVTDAINKIKTSSSYIERLNEWIKLNGYRISVSKDIVNDIYYEDIGTKFIDSSYYDKSSGIIKKNSGFV